MIDISSKTIKDVFDESNENASLLSVYNEVQKNKKIISQIINPILFRQELLSLYLSKHLNELSISSGKELTPEQPPKTDEPSEEPNIPEEKPEEKPK